MTLNNLFLNVATFLEPNLDFSEHLLFNDSDYFNLSALDFSESGLKIKQILESVYTDGITGLGNVKVKGKNIVGTFSDYLSPNLTNEFSFEITPDNVSYELINHSNISIDKNKPLDASGNNQIKGNTDMNVPTTKGDANYSEYLDFARVTKPKPIVDKSLKTKADKSGKIRSCTPGKTMPCGARCQAIGKPCKEQPLAPELKELQKEIVTNQSNKSEPIKTASLSSSIVLSGSRLAKLPGRESKSENTDGSNTESKSQNTGKKDKVTSNRELRNRGKVTATKAIEQSLKKVSSALDKERKKLSKLKDPEEKGKSYRKIFALSKAFVKMRDIQSKHKESKRPLNSGDLRVLGLKPGRPQERELVDAYRKISRKYHPDSNIGASAAKKTELSAKFIEATESYEKLRKEYHNDYHTD